MTLGLLGSSSRKLAIAAEIGGSDEVELLKVEVAATARVRRKVGGNVAGWFRRRDLRSLRSISAIDSSGRRMDNSKTRRLEGVLIRS